MTYDWDHKPYLFELAALQKPGGYLAHRVRSLGVARYANANGEDAWAESAVIALRALIDNGEIAADAGGLSELRDAKRLPCAYGVEKRGYLLIRVRSGLTLTRPGQGCVR